MAGKKTEEPDPRITKRRVTQRSAILTPEGTVITAEKVDYVPDDDRNFFDAYVAAAREQWQVVEVSEEYDAGPGGYHGATYVPDHLDVPLAGTMFDATPENERD